MLFFFILSLNLSALGFSSEPLEKHVEKAKEADDEELKAIEDFYGESKKRVEEKLKEKENEMLRTVLSEQRCEDWRCSAFGLDEKNYYQQYDELFKKYIIKTLEKEGWKSVEVKTMSEEMEAKQGANNLGVFFIYRNIKNESLQINDRKVLLYIAKVLPSPQSDPYIVATDSDFKDLSELSAQEEKDFLEKVKTDLNKVLQEAPEDIKKDLPFVVMHQNLIESPFGPILLMEPAKGEVLSSHILRENPILSKSFARSLGAFLIASYNAKKNDKRVLEEKEFFVHDDLPGTGNLFYDQKKKRFYFIDTSSIKSVPFKEAFEKIFNSIWLLFGLQQEKRENFVLSLYKYLWPKFREKDRDSLKKIFIKKYPDIKFDKK